MRGVFFRGREGGRAFNADNVLHLQPLENNAFETNKHCSLSVSQFDKSICMLEVTSD